MSLIDPNMSYLSDEKCSGISSNHKPVKKPNPLATQTKLHVHKKKNLQLNTISNVYANLEKTDEELKSLNETLAQYIGKMIDTQKGIVDGDVTSEYSNACLLSIPSTSCNVLDKSPVLKTKIDLTNTSSNDNCMPCPVDKAIEMEFNMFASSLQSSESINVDSSIVRESEEYSLPARPTKEVAYHTYNDSDLFVRRSESTLCDGNWNAQKQISSDSAISSLKFRDETNTRSPCIAQRFNSDINSDTYLYSRRNRTSACYQQCEHQDCELKTESRFEPEESMEISHTVNCAPNYEQKRRVYFADDLKETVQFSTRYDDYEASPGYMDEIALHTTDNLSAPNKKSSEYPMGIIVHQEQYYQNYYNKSHASSGSCSNIEKQSWPSSSKEHCPEDVNLPRSSQGSPASDIKMNSKGVRGSNSQDSICENILKRYDQYKKDIVLEIPGLKESNADGINKPTSGESDRQETQADDNANKDIPMTYGEYKKSRRTASNSRSSNSRYKDVSNTRTKTIDEVDSSSSTNSRCLEFKAHENPKGKSRTYRHTNDVEPNSKRSVDAEDDVTKITGRKTLTDTKGCSKSESSKSRSGRETNRNDVSTRSASVSSKVESQYKKTDQVNKLNAECTSKNPDAEVGSTKRSETTKWDPSKSRYGRKPVRDNDLLSDEVTTNPFSPFNPNKGIEKEESSTWATVKERDPAASLSAIFEMRDKVTGNYSKKKRLSKERQELHKKRFRKHLTKDKTRDDSAISDPAVTSTNDSIDIGIKTNDASAKFDLVEDIPSDQPSSTGDLMTDDNSKEVKEPVTSESIIQPLDDITENKNSLLLSDVEPQNIEISNVMLNKGDSSEAINNSDKNLSPELPKDKSFENDLPQEILQDDSHDVEAPKKIVGNDEPTSTDEIVKVASLNPDTNYEDSKKADIETSDESEEAHQKQDIKSEQNKRVCKIVLVDIFWKAKRDGRFKKSRLNHLTQKFMKKYNTNLEKARNVILKTKKIFKKLKGDSSKQNIPNADEAASSERIISSEDHLKDEMENIQSNIIKTKKIRIITDSEEEEEANDTRNAVGSNLQQQELNISSEDLIKFCPNQQYSEDDSSSNKKDVLELPCADSPEMKLESNEEHRSNKELKDICENSEKSESKTLRKKKKKTTAKSNDHLNKQKDEKSISETDVCLHESNSEQTNKEKHDKLSDTTKVDSTKLKETIQDSKSSNESSKKSKSFEDVEDNKIKKSCDSQRLDKAKKMKKCSNIERKRHDESKINLSCSKRLQDSTEDLILDEKLSKRKKKHLKKERHFPDEIKLDKSGSSILEESTDKHMALDCDHSSTKEKINSDKVCKEFEEPAKDESREVLEVDDKPVLNKSINSAGSTDVVAPLISQTNLTNYSLVVEESSIQPFGSLPIIENVMSLFDMEQFPSIIDESSDSGAEDAPLRMNIDSILTNLSQDDDKKVDVCSNEFVPQECDVDIKIPSVDTLLAVPSCSSQNFKFVETQVDLKAKPKTKAELKETFDTNVTSISLNNSDIQTETQEDITGTSEMTDITIPANHFKCVYCRKLYCSSKEDAKNNYSKNISLFCQKCFIRAYRKKFHSYRRRHKCVGVKENLT